MPYSSTLLGSLAMWYLVLSGITFGVYLYDKLAAIGQGPRIPERALHLLSLFGGWPGALVAQKIFRHKVAKASFMVRFWVGTLLNIVCAASVTWTAMNWSQ